MLIQILTLTVLQYNRRSYDREHVHMFIAKDQKLNLVVLAKSYDRTAIEIYL